MQKCVFLALVCVALVRADSPAAATSVPYSPQEKYLALANTGNFGCKVNSLAVKTDNPGVEAVILPEHVSAAFESVANLEWAHIAQTSFSAMDARNDEKVLSTPGGDMGEFVQALAAFAKVLGRDPTADQVHRAFERYLRTMTRAKFSFETDEKAYMNLAIATGCRNLHVSDMGGMKRKKEAYLANILKAEHIGDPFLKFLVQNATDLGFNTVHLQNALDAYHTILWTSPSRLASKLCYLEMKGHHSPMALLNIKTESFCVDQGLAPMVSPYLACPGPVLVNYPDAVRVLRRELVSALNDEFKANPGEVMKVFNEIAEANFNKWWGEIGVNLPVYTLFFTNSSPLLKSDVSFSGEGL